MIQISLKKVPLPRAVILNIPVTKIRLHAKQPFQFSIVSEHCKKMASSQRTISDLDLISFFRSTFHGCISTSALPEPYNVYTIRILMSCDLQWTFWPFDQPDCTDR